MALASSVMCSGACCKPCSNVCSSRPSRNICGVCASHLSPRGKVAATLGVVLAVSFGCWAFKVSGKGRASRPPTASCWQLCINCVMCAGVIRQRAASCTSTQSSGCAPLYSRCCRPLRTLSARLAPPMGACAMRCVSMWAGTGNCANQLSCAASTSKMRSMLAQALNAASVCHSRACPANGWYCLGMWLPLRLPLPAQGISA